MWFTYCQEFRWKEKKGKKRERNSPHVTQLFKADPWAFSTLSLWGLLKCNKHIIKVKTIPIVCNSVMVQGKIIFLKDGFGLCAYIVQSLTRRNQGAYRFYFSKIFMYFLQPKQWFVPFKRSTFWVFGNTDWRDRMHIKWQISKLSEYFLLDRKTPHISILHSIW